MLQIDDKARALGLEVTAIGASNLDNRDYGSGLEHWLAQQYTLLRQESAEAADRRQHILAGFQRLRQAVGRSWKRFPASPAALWAQFQRRGELMRISPAVDIYNLLSLQTGLSLGGHDCDRLSGTVSLTVSQGGELFQALGEDKAVALPEGEYIYRDDRQVLCRMDCRQADRSKLTADSQRALFILQGHQWMAEDEIHRCSHLLASLLEEHCGARVEFFIGNI